MDVKDRSTQTEPRKTRRARGWVVAATSFAIVILVVGLVAMLGGPAEDGTPPATDDQTPSTVVESTPTTQAPETEAAPEASSTTTVGTPDLDPDAVAFVEGFAADINSGDHEAAFARLEAARELRTPASPGNDLRNAYRVTFEVWTLLESEVRVDSCHTQSSGVTVCQVATSSVHDPYYPLEQWNVFQVRLEDGEPAFLSIGPNDSEPWIGIHYQFSDWVFENQEAPILDLYFYEEAESVAEAIRSYVKPWRDDQGIVIPNSESDQ